MKGNNKKRITVTIITLLLVVFTIGITYAFIIQTLTGTKEVVINAGVLDLVLEEENAITISNALPMHDAVGMIQEDVFVFRLVNKTSNPTNYVLKLQEIETGTLDKSIVKYGLIKEGEKTIDLVSNIIDGVIDEGRISGNDTINYELRLWIDSSVTEIAQVEKKFLSFKVSVSASQEIAKSPSSVEVKLFADENLGSNCKTYDDGVDTFLVGQCSNNYVWYSGKLWRVVLKNNETGNVKMITDSNITSIPYDLNEVAFKDSYIDQWLNQEFLPTLHDYEDYLIVDGIWQTTNGTEDISRPTGIDEATRTVGLLNTYEYHTTYISSDGLATYSNTYLNNATYWNLMSSQSSGIVNGVVNTGGSNWSFPGNALGVRPSVNLKSNIQVFSGTGDRSNPYILEGDIQEPENGTTLLNTRYSGEYITFNNELYRIVGIENNLTKITAIAKPSEFSSLAFDTSDTATTNFNDSSIKSELEEYYQGLKTSNEAAYNMIEPNTIWYLGTLQDNHYKASICEIVDDEVSTIDCRKISDSTKLATASIGLPRVGEIFTSRLAWGNDYWTLTPAGWPDANVNWLNANHAKILNDVPTATIGARPSMYLKHNVVIASNNTGNGTYEHPYSIELNQ